MILRSKRDYDISLVEDISCMRRESIIFLVKLLEQQLKNISSSSIAIADYL